MTEFIRRSLTRDEAETLHALIRLTPNILGYRTAELMGFNDVWIAEWEGTFAGACLLVDLPLGWTEIAVLYVLEEFRGKGIGKELFDRAWRMAQDRKRSIYVISRDASVLKLMRERGMRIERNLLKAPLAVHLYNGKYMASPYRIGEALRKIPLSRGKPPFLFGVRKLA